MAENPAELFGWENLTNSYVVVFYTNYNAPQLILLHPTFFEFLKGQANSVLYPLFQKVGKFKKAFDGGEFFGFYSSSNRKSIKTNKGELGIHFLTPPGRL